MTNRSAIVFFVGCVVLFKCLSACTDNSPKTTVQYAPAFSAEPEDSNALIFGFPSFGYSESADEFIKYLNVNSSGLRIKMKACISYDQYLDMLKQQKFDFTLISGIQAMLSSDNNYSIRGKISNDKAYTGVVFSRKDAAIRNVSDLKGKKVALVPVNVIPGTMMPLYYLFKNKLDVNHDIRRVNVSSFESAIIATYLGKAEAGICLRRNWDIYIKNHPEILSRVILNWETPPLINNALLIRNGIDSATVAKLEALLFSIHQSPEGRRAIDKLGISGFERANKELYKPMLEFKRTYDSVIL